MHHDLVETISSPWAIQADRLPCIRAALQDPLGGKRHSTLRMRAYDTTNDAVRRRQIGNDGIAVLPFYGVAVQRTDALGEAIGFVSIRRFTQAFRTALADDFVRGIVIDIDSPGGSVYGVAELADEI